MATPASRRRSPRRKTAARWTGFERKIRCIFRKKGWLSAALTHPSRRNEEPAAALEDFERLEFFGDTILNFVISEQLYGKFPDAKEGELSQLRATLVSKKMLNRVAEKISLPAYVCLGRSEADRPGEEKCKIYADTLEALIAALYFDQGMAKARAFILKHFGPYVNSRFLRRIGISPKNKLQEWVQRRFKILPAYRTEQRDDYFLSWSEVLRKGRASGMGRSKKEAEERAAKLLLSRLRKKFG